MDTINLLRTSGDALGYQRLALALLHSFPFRLQERGRTILDPTVIHLKLDHVSVAAGNDTRPLTLGQQAQLWLGLPIGGKRGFRDGREHRVKGKHLLVGEFRGWWAGGGGLSTHVLFWARYNEARYNESIKNHLGGGF